MKGKYTIAGILLFALLRGAAGAAEGGADATEDRLLRVEKELSALQESQLKLKQEMAQGDKSGPATVRAGGKEIALQLSGMLQVQVDGGDRGDSRFGSDNTRFYLRRARLGGTAQFNETIEARVEAEFAGTLGEANAMRAQLTDGYLQWKPLDSFHAKAGQFKTPFGFEQLASDPRLPTIERSLGNDRLTLSRQIGIQAGGDLAAKRLSYALGAFNGTSVNSSSNDNSKFTLVGRLGIVPLAPAKGSKGPRLALGINGYISDDDQVSGQGSDYRFNTSTNATPNNVFAGERAVWGADAQFSQGPVEIWAEMLSARYEPDNKKPADQVDAGAWYVQATCYLLPEKVQAVLKYDTFDPNTDADNDGTDTWTLGLNYYIRGNDLKLQFNYLRSDVESRDATDNKLIARVQVLF
ncbi:MAG: OprO/OprP family phosphate-selective porin [Kiritimatiellae bacterium]|nr:OprO/OprP family phosphate-selective porin [Kiritimatiellia bacterium]